MFIDELKLLVENLDENQMIALTINADLEYYIHRDKEHWVEVEETDDKYIVVTEGGVDWEETLFILKQDSIIAVSIRENPLLQGGL